MIPTLKLIEKQIAMSSVRERMEEEYKHRSEEAPPLPGRFVTKEGIAFGPCVFISRECGSGGSLLAQKIGERLGWGVFDSKIVDEIAQMAHVQQRLVQSVDEHVHSAWERTWRQYALDDLPDKKYLHHLRQVVMTLGHHGNVIFVGRGAEFFLPPQCGLRVRLVAPVDFRAQRIAENDKISMDRARSKVNVTDAERVAFVWKAFGKDVGSPLNQDLIINTGEFNLDATTDLVLAAIKAKLGAGVEESSLLEKI
jgi:cytidylate kinase